MKRDELEALLIEASRITRKGRFLIIGSAAILGSFRESELPRRATLSTEADMTVMGDSIGALTEQLEQSGWGSPFHQKHGIYIDPVRTDTAILPEHWMDRLVEIRAAGGVLGYCLDPYDLCSAKLARYEEKDREFVLALSDARLIDLRRLRGRFSSIKDPRLTPGKRRMVTAELRKFQAGGKAP